ncbi:MAG: hypothetical protein GY820_28030 [Gammaproteobacteria bacterium]|nr:hypothetical protein [Gammaproteobacteria bacterium]
MKELLEERAKRVWKQSFYKRKLQKGSKQRQRRTNETAFFGASCKKYFFSINSASNEDCDEYLDDETQTTVEDKVFNNLMESDCFSK